MGKASDRFHLRYNFAFDYSHLTFKLISLHFVWEIERKVLAAVPLPNYGFWSNKRYIHVFMNQTL